MDEFAKLLTAVASIITAVAWPATLLVIVFVFRGSIRTALGRLPNVLDRVKKASMAGVALELDRVADAAAGGAPDQGGKITPQQVEAAARIAVETRDVGWQVLLGELDRLCLEYDALRRTLPSGDIRTRAMSRIIIKMRSLSPSVIDFLDAYKGSGSAGSRLAAIAMMQMVPKAADLEWLEGRFSSEQPFVFYHAALALQNLADYRDAAEAKMEVRAAAERALAKVKNFPGTPDRSTLEVLEALVGSLHHAAHGGTQH